MPQPLLGIRTGIVRIRTNSSDKVLPLGNPAKTSEGVRECHPVILTASYDTLDNGL